MNDQTRKVLVKLTLTVVGVVIGTLGSMVTNLAHDKTDAHSKLEEMVLTKLFSENEEEEQKALLLIRVLNEELWEEYTALVAMKAAAPEVRAQAQARLEAKLGVRAQLDTASVLPGNRRLLKVTVVDRAKNPVPFAKVQISSTGGSFPDSKDSSEGPAQTITGKTDAHGVCQVAWTCKPTLKTCVIAVWASKQEWLPGSDQLDVKLP